MEERKKSKEKDVQIKKLEDEVLVQRIHMKLLQKRPQPELEEAKCKLIDLGIAKGRLPYQVRRLERELKEAQDKIKEYQDILKEPLN